MRAKATKTKRILPKAISAFLVFWLSGVLILVCCSSHLFTASASNVVTEESESCPMKKGHDCCQKNQGESISETEKDQDACCIFKPGRTLSNDLQNNQQVKQAQTVVELFQTPTPVYFIKQTYKSPKIYQSAIRNRGSTYLKNCIFRI